MDNTVNQWLDCETGFEVEIQKNVQSCKVFLCKKFASKIMAEEMMEYWY